MYGILYIVSVSPFPVSEEFAVDPFVRNMIVLMVALVAGVLGTTLGHESQGRMTIDTLYWVVGLTLVAGAVTMIGLKFVFEVLAPCEGPTWSQMSGQERLLSNIRRLRQIRDVYGRRPGSQLQTMEAEYTKLYGEVPKY